MLRNAVAMPQIKVHSQPSKELPAQVYTTVHT